MSLVRTHDLPEHDRARVPGTGGHRRSALAVDHGDLFSAPTTTTLAYGAVGAEASFDRDFTAPIVVAPVAGAKYCLDLYYDLASGTGVPDPFDMQITGYVAGGKYTPAAVAGVTPGAAVPKSVAVSGH